MIARAFLLLALAGTPAQRAFGAQPAAESSQRAAAEPSPARAEKLFNDELTAVRASRADLDVRPARWDTRSKIPAVERFLADPLAVSSETARWGAEFRAADSSAALMRLAAKRLELSVAASGGVDTSDRVERREREVPPIMRPALRDILKAISRAQLKVDRSLESLPPADREAALNLLGRLLRHDETGRLSGDMFSTMEKFDRAPIVEAAQELAAAIDRALPSIWSAAPGMKNFKRHRWPTPYGDVVISGSGDDRYDPEDLDGVALLIDAGGGNRYSGPAAAAHAGQIRVVIDLGENVTVENPADSFGAGSGVFGIGFLYMPNPAGVKSITAHDFSCGAGLFGVGGLFVAGSSVSVSADHFSQGAAAYGVGILSVAASTSSYSLRFAGQGLGYTGGAGLFRVRGDNARIDGGLYYPDPREGLAALSLAQGVGYGPRAFAAGGIGLALVDGNRAALNSSYFAQGSGYWHALGALFVFGNDNRLQARRYDQGAGIHTAVGVLQIEGDRNQTVNWGVGPAFGWDYGVGVWTLNGNDSTSQADWSAGHGDYVGHAFAFVRGDRNRMSLPDFGSGGFSRGVPSYGIAIVSGSQNRYYWNHSVERYAAPFDFRTAPWGVLHGDGLTLDPTVKFPRPAWPEPDREEALQKETFALQSLIGAALAKPEPERIADFISIASSFGLADTSQGRPAEALLSLGDDRLETLAEQLSPDHFDEFAWLRSFVAAYGPKAAPAVAKLIARSAGLRKSLAMSFLSALTVDDGLRLAEKQAADSDWRVRRAAAGVIAGFFSREACQESGRRTILRAYAEAFPARLFAKKSGDLLYEKRLGDLFALLALNPGFSPEERASLMAKAKNPFDAIPPEAVAEFDRIVEAHRAVYRRAFRAELKRVDSRETAARQVLLKLAADPDHEVRHSALLGLGLIGNPADVPAIAPVLESDRAMLREGAALALAKMGDAARAAIASALHSPDARTRAVAVLAAAHSSSRRVIDLMHAPLGDPDAGVRATAVSALCRFQIPLLSSRKHFIKTLARLESSDPSPSVRATASYALVLIPK